MFCFMVPKKRPDIPVITSVSLCALQAWTAIQVGCALVIIAIAEFTSFGTALCSIEQRGSDYKNSSLVLALTLFDCRGGSKENYRSFSITSLGQGIASLLHDKTPSGFPVVLLDLFSNSPVAQQTCLQ
jgi:hypothetical protein